MNFDVLILCLIEMLSLSMRAGVLEIDTVLPAREIGVAARLWFKRNAGAD